MRLAPIEAASFYPRLVSGTIGDILLKHNPEASRVKDIAENGTRASKRTGAAKSF